MLNSILKVGFGVLCVYFMYQEQDVEVGNNENATKSVEAVATSNMNYGNVDLEELEMQYYELFDELKNSYAIKPDSELKEVYLIDDEIVLNVNESFIYIGGIYKEKQVINKIVELGLYYDNIDYVTVLVDGKIGETSEGIDLYKISKPFELY